MKKTPSEATFTHESKRIDPFFALEGKFAENVSSTREFFGVFLPSAFEKTFVDVVNRQRNLATQRLSQTASV
jgi:hypothetical protein